MDNLRHAQLLETVEHFNDVENVVDHPEEMFGDGSSKEEQEIEEPSLHILAAQTLGTVEERFYCNVGNCDFKYVNIDLHSNIYSGYM